MNKPNETKDQSTAEYQNSTESLMRIAQRTTGASKFAAKGLLSAHLDNTNPVETGS